MEVIPINSGKAKEFVGSLPKQKELIDDYYKRIGIDGVYANGKKRVMPIAWTANEWSFAALFELQECVEDLMSGMFIPTGNTVCKLRVWDLKSKEEQSVVISTDLVGAVKAMGFRGDDLLVCGSKSVRVKLKSN